MRIRPRRRRTIGFIVLGVCLAGLAAGFNVSWLLVNGREGIFLLVGILLFPLVVAGVVLNTIFLVREIRRNEQHNAFINAVTHELKTPVASIRLYLETLQSRDVEPAQRQDFYRVMLADSDRLLNTVEQILRTGRAGHPPRSSELQELSLPELVRACGVTVAGRYDLNPEALGVLVAREAASAKVRGDPEELHSAVSNLLDNAVKYSLNLDRPPRVEVRIDADDPRYWTVRVSDNGVGIPPAELKSVFKRFYRVPNPLVRVSGTGLGLFIVRSVVRRHGGRILAESAGVGLGSTFTVHLPRALA